MNLRIQQLLRLHRLYEPAGDGGSNIDGGTQGGAAGAGDGGEGSGEGDGGAAGAGASGQQDGSGDGGKPSGDKKPSDAEAKLIRDVMKQKQRALELEAELARAKGELKNFEGVDPAKARELLAKEEEAARAAAEARGEYDRLVKQMGERHTEEKQRLERQLQEEQASKLTLAQQIAELTVGNAFGNSQFVSKDLTLTPSKARTIYGSHFEFKDGKVLGYDKPQGASDRTVLVDSTGEPLAFDEALRVLVNKDPDRESLLRTSAKPGAGSSSSQKGARRTVQSALDAQSDKRTGVQKIAAGLKKLANP